MADTSGRIIILSAVVLVGIIVWTSTLPQIVSLDDIRIELETKKVKYVVNEGIRVKVYFYNERPFAVRVNTNIDTAIIGYTPERESSPASLGHGYPVVYSEIPPNSRIEFYTGMLTPKYSGEFFISCLGANKTVQILDSESEDETARSTQLANSTVENIRLEWHSNSLEYHNDPPVFEYNVTILIVNPGPLKASLSNSTLTIIIEGEQIAINSLDNDISLRLGEVYEIETEDSSVTILDPYGYYKQKLSDMSLEYQIVLNAELSCGPLNITLTKSWSHILGFIGSVAPKATG